LQAKRSRLSAAVLRADFQLEEMESELVLWTEHLLRIQRGNTMKLQLAASRRHGPGVVGGSPSGRSCTSLMGTISEESEDGGGARDGGFAKIKKPRARSAGATERTSQVEEVRRLMRAVAEESAALREASARVAGAMLATASA